MTQSKSRCSTIHDRVLHVTSTIEKSPHDTGVSLVTDVDPADGCDEIGVPDGPEPVMVDHQRRFGLCTPQRAEEPEKLAWRPVRRHQVRDTHRRIVATAPGPEVGDAPKKRGGSPH